MLSVEGMSSGFALPEKRLSSAFAMWWFGVFRKDINCEAAILACGPGRVVVGGCYRLCGVGGISHPFPAT